MKKKTLSYVLLVIFITYLAVYIKNHHADFKALQHVSLTYLSVIAVAQLLSIFLNGLFVKYTLLPFNKKVSSSESFFVSLIATMGNYFLPVGAGTGMKAVYLKRKFKLAYADFMATLSGNYIIVFMLNSFFGILALLVLKKYAPPGQFLVLFVVLGAIFTAMLMLATVGFPKLLISWLSKTRFLGKLSKLISQVLRGWNIITKHSNLLVKLVLITIVNFLISMVVTHYASVALGLNIGIWPLTLYTSLGSLSFLLNVTPGSIGIRESIFIFSSATLGLTTSQILSISIIQNGVLFFVLVSSWLLLQVPYLKQKLVPDALLDID